LDFPLLSTVSGSFSISTNKDLKSINIPKLTVISTAANFGINALPSTEINKLLNNFNNKITFTGATSKSIFLQGQTPKAPPTGQGVIDKNSLVSKGFTVYTD
jgi:hypothetical protein